MMICIDFKNDFGNKKLYSGRKNGERARDSILKKLGNEQNDGYWTFTSRDGQLITSSYFLGLLGDSVYQFNTVEDAFNKINLDGLDPRSKEECIRAIKRGTTPNEGLF